MLQHTLSVSGYISVWGFLANNYTSSSSGRFTLIDIDFSPLARSFNPCPCAAPQFACRKVNVHFVCQTSLSTFFPSTSRNNNATLRATAELPWNYWWWPLSLARVWCSFVYKKAQDNAVMQKIMIQAQWMCELTCSQWAHCEVNQWDPNELKLWAHRRPTHRELTATSAWWAQWDDLTNS